MLQCASMPASAFLHNPQGPVDMVDKNVRLVRAEAGKLSCTAAAQATCSLLCVPIGDLFHCCPGCRPSPARCGSGWEVSGQLLTQIPDDLELDHADPGLALGSSRRRARWADPGKQAAASIQQTWQTKAPLWFPSMCHWLLSSPRNQNQTPKTLNRGVLWESTPKP